MMKEEDIGYVTVTVVPWGGLLKFYAWGALPRNDGKRSMHSVSPVEQVTGELAQFRRKLFREKTQVDVRTGLKEDRTRRRSENWSLGKVEGAHFQLCLMRSRAAYVGPGANFLQKLMKKIFDGVTTNGSHLGTVHTQFGEMIKSRHLMQKYKLKHSKGARSRAIITEGGARKPGRNFKKTANSNSESKGED